MNIRNNFFRYIANTTLAVGTGFFVTGGYGLVTNSLFLASNITLVVIGGVCMVGYVAINVIVDLLELPEDEGG